MAAAQNYAAEGNEDEWNGDGEETASAGGCDQNEQQKLDSNDGEEEEEAGSGYNRVRGWGRATEAVAMQEKGWQSPCVLVVNTNIFHPTVRHWQTCLRKLRQMGFQDEGENRITWSKRLRSLSN